jgi:hypothetical protein
MGVIGLLLAAVYALVVTEKRLRPEDAEAPAIQSRAPLRGHLPKLFSSLSVVCSYVGSGLQFVVSAALLARLPSYFNRYYHMASAKAGRRPGCSP